MQEPYRPGENNRLSWVDPGVEGPSLAPGSAEAPREKPRLVLIYSGDMAKDCCAANFERSVFRYRPVVQAAAGFECFKIVYGGETGIFEGIELEAAKPAIVLIDGEGALLHKQQRCVDPKAYLATLRQALEIHERRNAKRESYTARRLEAREKAAGEEYRKALQILDGILAKQVEVARSVLKAVEADRAALVKTGKASLEEAAKLRKEGEIEEAKRLYSKLRNDFEKVPEVYKEATRAFLEIEAILKKQQAAGT